MAVGSARLHHQVKAGDTLFLFLILFIVIIIAVFMRNGMTSKKVMSDLFVECTLIQSTIMFDSDVCSLKNSRHLQKKLPFLIVLFMMGVGLFVNRKNEEYSKFNELSCNKNVLFYASLDLNLVF